MSAKKKLGPGRHLSAIKRHRQSVKRNELNKPARSAVRTATKQLRKAIEGFEAGSDAKALETLFAKTQSLTDKAIKRGLIHARAGHRHIARLHRSLHALTAGKTAAQQ